jgi:hypothetical protein
MDLMFSGHASAAVPESKYKSESEEWQRDREEGERVAAYISVPVPASPSPDSRVVEVLKLSLPHYDILADLRCQWVNFHSPRQH